MLPSLTWLTILSLDAPLVAIAWQALFAATNGSRLRWEQRAVLFASVWLGYAADRWLDARRDADAQSARHRWHRRHSHWLVLAWTGVLAAAVTLAFSHLSAPDLRHGLGLLIAALVYTVFAQGAVSWRRYGELKCALVGMLIAASASLFAFNWTWSAAGTHLQPIALASLLFTFNCLLIRRWEGLLAWSAIGIASFAVALNSAGIVLALLFPEQRPISAAVILASSGLCLLDVKRQRLTPQRARALADLALLAALPALLLS